MKSEQTVHYTDGISIVAGLWLILAPFILGFSGTAAATNDIILGVVIALIALYRVVYPSNMPTISWVNVVLGAWLVISAFVFPGVTAVITWNNLLLGALVIVMDSWGMSATMKGKGVH